MSRVSRRWTREDWAAYRGLFRELSEGTVPLEVAQLRFVRLRGQWRRADRVKYGPRKAFRRSL